VPRNIHRKNAFAEISKNLAKYGFINNFVVCVNHQNNSVENSNMTSNATKNFDILATF